MGYCARILPNYDTNKSQITRSNLYTVMKIFPISIMAGLCAGKIIIPTGADPSCMPSNYNYPWVYSSSDAGEVWFSHTSGSVTWDGGFDGCRAIGAGVELAAILNSVETTAVQNLVTENAWVGGIIAVHSHNNWMWVQAQKNQYLEYVSWTNWGSGEPNKDNGAKEDCMAFTDSTGQWYDADCGHKDKVAVCQLRC